MCDNFHVRVLLGEEAYFSPPGSIGAAELERAKAVLDAFVMVVPLDRFAEGMVLASRQLGWQSPHATSVWAPRSGKRVCPGAP